MFCNMLLWLEFCGLAIFWHYENNGFKKRHAQNSSHSNILRRFLSELEPQQDFDDTSRPLFSKILLWPRVPLVLAYQTGLWLQNREGTLPECEPQVQYSAKTSGTAATAICAQEPRRRRSCYFLKGVAMLFDDTYLCEAFSCDVFLDELRLASTSSIFDECEIEAGIRATRPEVNR